MSQTPEFLRFRCTAVDSTACTSCGREFVIPIGAIEGVFRTPEGKVEIGVSGSHFCVDPMCLCAGAGVRDRVMYIKTDMTWNDVITLLDGAVANVGDVSMKQY